MITIILPYYNSLKQHPDRTKKYFDMINNYLGINNDLQFIVSDYGSNDDIKMFIKRYPRFRYIYTEPNEGEFFNISKCCNNALKIAKNNIIFTNGIDWRYNYNFLQYVMEMYRKLGEMTLEVPITVLRESGDFEKFIHTPIFLRRFLIYAGGWDERIFNWGQEDHDLIQSIFHFQNIPIHRYIHPMYNIFHLWHENILYNTGGGKERNKDNQAILKDNIVNKRENVINSYWKNDNGMLRLL